MEVGPAYAGMILAQAQKDSDIFGRPRVCGDDPSVLANTKDIDM